MPLLTSIHWHGISQRKSNWADGTSFVTQCPIAPGGSFVHRFSTLGQTGTYWYHSHYSTQYCDGLRGPLVIYDPDDPRNEPQKTRSLPCSRYHNSSLLLNSNTAVVIPDSTLINGLGRYAGGPPSPLAVVDVVQGLRYRFRILGLSCASWFNFTIDGHTMTVIEADGVETLPMVVHSLPVFPGQRYSVVVTADQPIGNYWIRASSNLLPDTFDGGLNSAILRYAGAPEADPATSPGPYELEFNESLLRPLNNMPVPGGAAIGKADVQINLVPGLVDGIFDINGVPYQDPPVPVLLQILSGARHPSQLLPKGSVYELPPNKVIELSFPATDGLPNGANGGPHPVHLHGHNFWVVRSAGNSTANFVNPIKRDTVSMGSQGDNVTVRFVTDNPGPWFWHCHIDWHLHHGFAVVMAESTDETAVQESAVIPQDWLSLCPSNIISAARLGISNRHLAQDS